MSSNKNMAHAETLYALKRQGRGPVASEIVYRFAPSIQEVWRCVIEEQVLGTGQTVQTLRSAGWKAVKVVVQEV